jgi:hypothetical protein
VPADQTYSSTFEEVGKLGLVDPLNENEKGTARMNATPAPRTTVTLTATPSTVSYGQVSVMEGRLGNGGNDQKIDILATECGSKTAKLVGSGMTGTGGLYAVLTHPARRTTYRARWRTSLSPTVSVGVRPVVAPKKLKQNRFSVSVLAGRLFVGKSVAIRRYVGRTKHWYTIGTITLRRRAATTTTMPGSIATTAAFAARLGRGVTIRAVLPPAQSGSCYLVASSPAVRS